MIWNAFTLALREIRNNLLRSMLTTLGIIIGVGAVIMMVTLGNGVTASLSSSISSLGRNLLVIQPGQRGIRARTAFQIADAEAVGRDVNGLAHSVPELYASAVAIVGNRNHPTQIDGTTDAFFEARDWAVVTGRTFTAGEELNGKAVCVLGQTVREDLFGVQDPVGQRVRLGKVTCQVVGVLETKGSTFMQGADDIVIMPVRAVQRLFTGNTDIALILVAVRNADAIDKAKTDITQVLRKRRHLGKNEEDDFNITDMRQVSQFVQTMTGTLTLFLSAIAAVSLLVGGIGIMNVMLVSVTERTREIGIRLAIGARAHDVLLQFLIEAAVISALGGLIGIAVGLSGAAAITAWFKLPFVFDPAIVMIAVAFSAGVGVAFGYFPARRAARLDPIEALRHE
ncbi:MAG: ABC transporter permease [Alphaproteobacteria bacterium]|nr:ABC transporter permease [Alphaproteobacteria bacterium]